MSTKDLASDLDRLNARQKDLVNALNKRHNDIVAKAANDIWMVDKAEKGELDNIMDPEVRSRRHWYYQAQRDAINAKLTKDLCEINPSAPSGASTL